jgi:hypothetical protein
MKAPGGLFIRRFFLPTVIAGALATGCGASDEGDGDTNLDGGSDGAAGSGAVGGGVGGSGAGGSDVGGSAGGMGEGAALGEELCPAAGPEVGIDIGDQLPSFTVKSCDGADVSLDELCGANGLWIFAAHGWCPICQSVSGDQEAVVDAHASEGLVAVTVIVETAQQAPPDASYCALWRDTYGLEDVYTLYDPSGALLELWPNGSSSLHAFVNRDRIITGKLEHTSNAAAIETQIAQALAP